MQPTNIPAPIPYSLLAMPRIPDTDADDHAMERLGEKVGNVEHELASLRQTLDEIRDDIAWWMKNNQKDEWQPIQPITSMPADSLAPDWAQRLNRYSPKDLSTPLAASQSPTRPAERAESQRRFCCDASDLRWTGEPEFPGISCANCGYTAVDCGTVVMTPVAESAEPSRATDTAAQQELF